MSERIDLTLTENISLEDLIAEVKRCYEAIDKMREALWYWGLSICPRSHEMFEWAYGCQSEKCASFDDDCRELLDDWDHSDFKDEE